MNIPNLPTDNLYKFLAITGVVLVVLGVLIPTPKNQNVTKEQLIINGEIDSLNLEMSILQNENDELSNYIKNNYSQFGLKFESQDSLIVSTIQNNLSDLAASEAAKKIKDQMDKNRQFTRNKQRIIRKIEYKRKAFRNSVDEANSWVVIGSWFINIGIFLSCGGFITWYYKTQRNLDIVLAEQIPITSRNFYCQSCGMNLKYDKMVDVKKDKYCSFCYTDGHFNHDVNLKEFKLLINQRLIDLKINRISRWAFLKGIDDLERWKHKFTWK